jgi:hypothetical protein
MPRTRKEPEEVEEEEVEDLEESDEETSPTSRGPQPPRISITLPVSVRKKVRIAAAKADMEINDWCKAVLVKAATITLEKLGLD